MRPELKIILATSIVLGGCKPLAPRSPEATATVKSTATETWVPPTITQTPTATETPTPTETLEPIHIVTSEADLANADTVLDGQTAEYAKRVLAAYQRGEIKNFDPSIKQVSIQDGTDFGAGWDKEGYGLYIWPDMLSVDQEKGKAVFPVTVVKDGEGGFRIIQIWLQKDKDPGLVWYKIPKERVAEEPNYTIRFINSIFGNPKVERILLPEMFKDASSCQVWWRSEQLKSVCESYMIPEIKSQRDTAIQKWISSGIIPQEIQNGELEFFAARQAV